MHRYPMKNKETTFSKLKTGDMFTLEVGGPVWIKRKGGFENAGGGQLRSCQPRVVVYLLLADKETKTLWL